MWFLRRSRSSNFYLLLLLILLIICLYITLYDRKFADTLPFKFFDISTNLDDSSIEYFRVRLDLTSNDAICQSDDFLIVYILSTINNFPRRDIIRSTWGSKRIGTCFIFIIGEVAGMTPDAGTLQLRINNERRQYHDIVQINHLETYANVVYKEVAALQWTQIFYPNISYLFKTDDDLVVDTLLLSFMAKLLVTNVSDSSSFILKFNPLLISNLISSDRATFFRGAWAMEFQPTLRGGGKFGVNESVWPHEFLPPYCSGFGWIMSKNVRDKLVMASYTYPLNKVVWIGDVFASGFLAKAANVRCRPIPIDYDQTLSANCSCLMANNPLLTVCSSTFHIRQGGIEQQKYNEYRKAWNIIQLRHNLSAMVTTDC